MRSDTGDGPGIARLLYPELPDPVTREDLQRLSLSLVVETYNPQRETAARRCTHAARAAGSNHLVRLAAANTMYAMSSK